MSFGRPAALPSGKSENSRTRHAGPLDDVLGATHHHGGDAGALEQAGDQRERLVADRAVRDQDRRIDPGPPGSAPGISGASTSSVVRWLRLVGAPWKRGASGPIRPAAAARRKAGERKVRAWVLGRRVLAVDRDVADAQVVLERRVAGSRRRRTWPSSCRARRGPGRRPRAGAALPS
jgi:hypothetical protein